MPDRPNQPRILEQKSPEFPEAFRPLGIEPTATRPPTTQSSYTGPALIAAIVIAIGITCTVVAVIAIQRVKAKRHAAEQQRIERRADR